MVGARSNGSRVAYRTDSETRVILNISEGVREHLPTIAPNSGSSQSDDKDEHCSVKVGRKGNPSCLPFVQAPDPNRHPLLQPTLLLQFLDFDLALYLNIDKRIVRR